MIATWSPACCRFTYSLMKKPKTSISLEKFTFTAIFTKYIDPNDPEAQKAATKIQAVFRGHKTRKEMKSGDAQEETQNFEEEFRPDDKELCHAATKIQASFRGHQTRRQMNKPEDEELSKKMEKLDPKVQQEAEELDIDLTDPELHKAATKIQASFRGHKVRKPDDEKEDEKASGQ
ncbi:hypothetical protein LSTR_LSTR007805 [Laodelphax striatellus]|uniref:Neuromodulin n=1 Tax=Laodelphax striatellus TaxID=195883 RepID=A0A482WMQ0_LAOST|nr:hypothetical protein LSTR_LSTR007805 [Laodelphax striatellus]